MSQDSGGEPRQRTVAELLAQYGETGAGSATPKRRRRRAEDDAEETAPQAIIDRVLSDSGRMRPVQENAEPPQGRAERRAHRPGTPTEQNPPVPAPAPQMQAPPAPVQQPPSQQPPRDEQPTATQQPVAPQAPQPGLSQSAAERARRARRMTSRFTPTAPPGSVDETQQQPPVPPATGTFPPVRPQRGQHPDADQAELTDQLPAVPDEQAAPRWGEAPAGLGGPQSTMRAAPVAPDSTGEQTQYGMPALDDDEDGLDADASYAGAGALDGGYQDGNYQDTGYQNYDDADYSGSDYDGTDYDYGDEDYPAGQYDATEYDADDYQADEDDYDEDDEARDTGAGATSGREWLVLAGLIAAGVVGGALVWLGFNWLWGTLPQVALIPALIVIGGMVWIVRRVRNDDDLQTTVLSVLVGLVVTVSPAAFLLLDR